MKTGKAIGGLTIVLTALVGLIVAPLGLSPRQASADGLYTVRITVERVSETIGDVEPAGEADYYAVAFVDGQKLGPTSTVDDDNHITPDWELSTTIESDTGVVPVSLQIWDSDGFLRGDDEQVDISPDSGKKVVDLTLDLEACDITGDLTAICGELLQSEGDGGGSAVVDFRIEVVDPVADQDLRVRCLHDPIWPQPGESVTITAEAFNGNLNWRVADTIEIWIEDTTAPGAVSSGVTNTNVTYDPESASSFSYGCRVEAGGLSVWSGWRTVTVGASDDDKAVPVLFTGPRSSRIDIVFIADRDDYTSPGSLAFQNDVHNVIRNAYYNFDPFLTNQDVFNFWIASSLGNAESYEDGCDHSAPDISWMDTGAILHKDNFRDCAPGGEPLFSSEPTSLGTVLHETGHRPFGLADEYSGDGGYFQNEPFPNLHNTMQDVPIQGGVIQGCATDAPNLGRTEADCREFDETIPWWFDEDWYTSEPPSNDLMVDEGMPQGADVRRFEWLFDKCRSAQC